MCIEAILSASAHLHGDVPGQVDVGLVLVHPDLGHPQGVAPRVESDVIVVRFLRPCYVSHPGAGQHLHAAAAHPHLQVSDGEQEEEEVEETAGSNLGFCSISNQSPSPFVTRFMGWDECVLFPPSILEVSQ